MPGSPSGWAMRCRATGATSTGIETSVPSTVVAVETALTSTSTRGQQLAAREGGLVVGQRALVARAAGEVAQRAGVEALGDERLEVANGDGPEVARDRGSSRPHRVDRDPALGQRPEPLGVDRRAEEPRPARRGAAGRSPPSGPGRPAASSGRRTRGGSQCAKGSRLCGSTGNE